MEERIGQQLPGSRALLLVSSAEMLAGDVNNTNQRPFGYVVTLHHETDHRFVHYFIQRRLGATMSVTPHVSSTLSRCKREAAEARAGPVEFSGATTVS